MHPIVKAFINSNDNLGEILEKHYDKNQYLETVFYKLTHYFGIENVEEQIFIELDQALVKGHPDASLYLLFLSFSITFTRFRNKFQQARVLESIGFSLLDENLSPVIKAYFKISSAGINFYDGKTIEYERLIKETRALIDEKSPRYLSIILKIAVLLSEDGKLNELGNDEFLLLDSIKEKENSFTVIELKLHNSIQTGNYREGLELLQKYKEKFRGDRRYLIAAKSDLLKVLSGDFDENNFEETSFKIFVNTCRLLAIGNTEEAKIAFQKMQELEWPKWLNIPYYAYLPLHIELNLKNKGKARLLLQEINQRDGKKYMDDLFLARLQLLEMNREGAAESFVRLLQNVNRNGAMGRLIFELQFVKEMRIADIVLLMNRLIDREGFNNINLPKTESKNLIKKEKGIQLLIGDSLPMTQMKKLVKKFANLKEPVLITGETGTGKELVARAIHEEGSHSKQPFMAINCGALTETLLESELFGYEAGAFTGAQKERKGIFEAVGNGTVFLDEFGDISPKMQVSLLRVLESNEIRLIGGTKTRQVSCKIVIATNVELQKSVEEKRFREDLYFRLKRFDIKLPPLRERVEDIPQLIHYFLRNEYDPKGMSKIISKSLLEALSNYPWPGNVRELKNEMERLKILNPDKELLTIEDFDFSHLQGYKPPETKKLLETKIESKFESKLVPRTREQHQNTNVKNDDVLKVLQRGSKVDRRITFVKELFKEYKRLTRSQIIEIANVCPSTATQELRQLCDEGFIKRCMPTSSHRTFYFELNE